MLSSLLPHIGSRAVRPECPGPLQCSDPSDARAISVADGVVAGSLPIYFHDSAAATHRNIGDTVLDRVDDGPLEAYDLRRLYMRNNRW
jgi:hypothetical protein